MNNIFGEIKIRTLFWGIVLSGISVAIFIRLPLFHNKDVFGSNFIGAIFYVFIMLWLVYIAKRKKKNLIDIKSECETVRSNFKEILSLAIMSFVFSLGLAYLLPAIVYLINPDFAQLLISGENLVPKNNVDFLFLAIATIILAPIVEELIFRGILLHRLSIKWGIISAVFISSILFGISHLGLAVIGAFVFGITMTALYKKTNSISSSIVAHSINNAIAVLPTYSLIATGNLDFKIQNSMTDVYVPGIVGLIISTIAGVYLFRYIKQNWDKIKAKYPSNKNIFIILDNIRSMENVGSIFRTADAAGISKIYLCGITAKPPRKEIDKTSLGAVDFVEWEYADNIKALISNLKEERVTVLALEQDKRSIPYSSFIIANSNNLALIVGNETDGISKEILDLCDQIIEIPMYGQKNSLNVAVATGVAVYDIIGKIKNNFGRQK